MLNFYFLCPNLLILNAFDVLYLSGENLAILSTCVFHGCYFVLAAMSATFLQTPIMTRLVLLLLVPLNAIAEIRHGVSLEMAPLTLILVAVAAGKFWFPFFYVHLWI